MRLHVFSDLHLEFADHQPPAVDADVVIAAGDIRPGKSAVRWLATAYPRLPVLFVPGNHEYYGHAIPKLSTTLASEAQGTLVQVLDNRRFDWGDWTFLGATLWTDFALHNNREVAEAEAAAGMTDFRRIRQSPSYRRLRPSDVRRFHLHSVTWLEAELRNAAGRKVVVVTHHAPSARSLGADLTGDPLSPAYASNLDAVVSASRALLWVHGHTHVAVDYSLGATRVVSNPRGYAGQEVVGFDPGMVIEI